MNAKTLKGTQVRTGDKFGIAGYWVNKDLMHPIHQLYVFDPDEKVPGVMSTLDFIYFGPKRPGPLDISLLISHAK